MIHKVDLYEALWHDKRRHGVRIASRLFNVAGAVGACTGASEK